MISLILILNLNLHLHFHLRFMISFISYFFFMIFRQTNPHHHFIFLIFPIIISYLHLTNQISFPFFLVNQLNIARLQHYMILINAVLLQAWTQYMKIYPRQVLITESTDLFWSSLDMVYKNEITIWFDLICFWIN